MLKKIKNKAKKIISGETKVVKQDNNTEQVSTGTSTITLRQEAIEGQTSFRQSM